MRHDDGVDIDGGLVAALSGMPLFSGLRTSTLAGLAGSLTRHISERGDELFHEGDDGQTLYVILSGAVKISMGASGSKETVLAVLGPGDVLGELALFDPGPRTATATVVSDLLDHASLDRSALIPWLGTQPEAAELLLRVLARRLRATNAVVSDLISIDVPGRLAKALLDLAARFGVPAPLEGERAVRVDHGLTQEELARLVGASRESVNKALADFTGRGWMTVGQRGVVLLDTDRLGKRAH
jgi:CRP-like cAMP-binding protein